MSKETAFRLAKKALEDEILATSIYAKLSKRFVQDPLGSKFHQISKMEGDHVRYWRSFLEKRGHDVTSIRVGKLKLMAYGYMPAILGRGLTLRVMEMSEGDAVDLYSEIMEAHIAQEPEAQMLKGILEDELVHEQEFYKEESRFEGFLTYVKDAVLGMNDGLVEILSVTTGLAGVYGNSLQVALGGFIVAIAGALSMGISTYASARAQRQVHEGILRRIARASRYVAHVFTERVSSHMSKRGYSKEVSKAVAEESVKHHETLSRFIAEEEHGLRREALVNPMMAGSYAGLFNAFGALLPLLPYFFGLTTAAAVLLSVTLAGVTLAATGLLVAILANMRIRTKIVEMILSGLGSAAATYLIGKIASFLLGINSI